MYVRVLRIPVIDTHPIELGAEVLFDSADQLPREALQVGHIGCVFRGDDETKVVPIILAALRKGLGIGVLGVRAKQVGLFPVPRDPLAPKVAEMGAERRRSRSMTDDAGLDRHQTRAAGEETICPHAG